MSRAPIDIASDLPQFLLLLESVPWFLHVGKPHKRDRQVGRISSWGEWPGPERQWGDWFGRWPAVVRERIEGQGRRTKDLMDAWHRTDAAVKRLAIPNVPLYDSQEDAWYGPTCCVGDAAYIAALLGWHVLLGRPVSERLAEEWYWLSEGHWPCGFAERPPDYGNESLEDFPAGKLLVL